MWEKESEHGRGAYGRGRDRWDAVDGMLVLGVALNFSRATLAADANPIESEGTRDIRR